MLVGMWLMQLIQAVCVLQEYPPVGVMTTGLLINTIDMATGVIQFL